MADRLRDVIANARANKHCITVPGCHDAMSAVLIQRAGFEIAFMSPGALFFSDSESIVRIDVELYEVFACVNAYLVCIYIYIYT